MSWDARGTPHPYGHGMTVSVLLRLVSEALVQGRLVGRAVVIETGEEKVVRDAAERRRTRRRRAQLEPRSPGQASIDDRSALVDWAGVFGLGRLAGCPPQSGCGLGSGYSTPGTNGPMDE